MAAKAKIDSGRKELRLDEAAKLLGWNVDDLINKAARGEITIYFMPLGVLKVALVFSIKPNPLDCDPENFNASIAALVQNWIKESSKESLPGKLQKLQIKIEELSSDEVKKFEITSPPVTKGKFFIDNYTFYLNEGNYRPFYLCEFIGFQPIGISTLVTFRYGNPDIAICIDLQKSFMFSNSYLENLVHDNPDTTAEDFFHDLGIPVNQNRGSNALKEMVRGKLFVSTNPAIYFKDALKDGNLFVMKADLEQFKSAKLIANENKPAPNTGPRKSTLELYAAWQKMADEIIANKPNASKYDVADTIHKRLDKTDDKSLKKLLRDVSTIRQNIKVN